jgi:uncharacterized Tic20 family protein
MNLSTEVKENIEKISMKAESMGIWKFHRDEAGQVDFSPSNIIGLVISMLILAILAPVAISELVDVDTSSWSTTTQTVWDMLPIFAVIGFLLMILAPTVYKRYR